MVNEEIEDDADHDDEPEGRRSIETEADVEPRILSPEEMADRATEAVDRTGALREAGRDYHLSGAANPLRMPGELSGRDTGFATRRKPR